ncbi:MAG: secondary thiamine-phosphate synthase enzyme YjbQ [Ktedonobacterales bacterium]
MPSLTIATSAKDQIVDLTDAVADTLRGAERTSGACFVFAAHTTCAVTAADLDPGTDLDFLEALRRLLPPAIYRHPHNPAHAPDHILAAIIGPSLTVPYANRTLALGTWQRIVLVELNGPRQRTIHIAAL